MLFDLHIMFRLRYLPFARQMKTPRIISWEYIVKYIHTNRKVKMSQQQTNRSESQRAMEEYYSSQSEMEIHPQN